MCAIELPILVYLFSPVGSFKLKKYVYPDKVVIAIAGCQDEIAEDMKEFGEVEIIKEIE